MFVERSVFLEAMMGHQGLSKDAKDCAIPYRKGIKPRLHHLKTHSLNPSEYLESGRNVIE